MLSRIFTVLLIIISLYIIVYIISKIECNWYNIRFFNINTDKIDKKIRLIYLSDFHDKKRNIFNKGLLSDIEKLNPDYVVLGGDFIDFSTIQSKLNRAKLNNSIDFINKLSERVNKNLEDSYCNINRIFFGFGNHELRLSERTDNEFLMGEYKRFIKCLKDNNINILENNTFDIDKNVTISGLNLYSGYYTNMLSKNVIAKNIDREIIAKYFKNIDKNKYNIMAFHKPDYFADFFDYGFDLVLSGHNHGGLIKFPFIGCILSPDLKFFPKYYDGLYDINGKHLVVSKGIGEHFVKIRVNNRPEACVIDINGTNNI